MISSPVTSSSQGECSCGGVRFSVDFPTLWCAHCHCGMCRRAHGAGFVTWVGVAQERFHLLAGDALLRRYHSSPEATRSFCGRCGSPMFFESTRWPGEVHVALAHFTSPLDREPDKNAFAADRAHWIPEFRLPRDG